MHGPAPLQSGKGNFPGGPTRSAGGESRAPRVAPNRPGADALDRPSPGVQPWRPVGGGLGWKRLAGCASILIQLTRRPDAKQGFRSFRKNGGTLRAQTVTRVTPSRVRWTKPLGFEPDPFVHGADRPTAFVRFTKAKPGRLTRNRVAIRTQVRKFGQVQSQGLEGEGPVACSACRRAP